MGWDGTLTCGVVWCGVVWCGVVWCGVVWCGVVWCGVVWCGVVWCGVVWCAEGAVTRHNDRELLLTGIAKRAGVCGCACALWYAPARWPGSPCVWRASFKAVLGTLCRSACWCSCRSRRAHAMVPPGPAWALMRPSFALACESHTLWDSVTTRPMNRPDVMRSRQSQVGRAQGRRCDGHRPLLQDGWVRQLALHLRGPQPNVGVEAPVQALPGRAPLVGLHRDSDNG